MKIVENCQVLARIVPDNFTFETIQEEVPAWLQSKKGKSIEFLKILTIFMTIFGKKS